MKRALVSVSDKTNLVPFVKGLEEHGYEIVGGKHSWGEQDIDTGEELWKFFSRFVK